MYFAIGTVCGAVAVGGLVVLGSAIEGRPSEACVTAYSHSAARVRPVKDISIHPLFHCKSSWCSLD